MNGGPGKEPVVQVRDSASCFRSAGNAARHFPPGSLAKQRPSGEQVLQFRREALLDALKAR